MPSRTINGLMASGLLSISGTSTCQPARSVPLNRLTVFGSGLLQDEKTRMVIRKEKMIFILLILNIIDSFIKLPFRGAYSIVLIDFPRRCHWVEINYHFGVYFFVDF